MREDDGLEELVVTADEAGQTLIELLTERLYDVSTSGLRRIVRQGGATVNDAPAAEDRVLAEGDRVAVELPDEDEPIVRFKPAPLDGFAVVFEDDRCLVAVKPAGTAVIAERGDVEAPFLGAVLHHFEETGQSRRRARVVHRIDKDTSGLVLVAKDRDALRFLTEQFEGREVAKTYLALVQGEPGEEQEGGEIDLPIGPAGRGDRRQRVGGKVAKPARSTWEVAERFRGFALLRVSPHTGRQHQIRVHLEAIGFPLAVDPVYGGTEALYLSKIKPGYRASGKEKERPLMSRLSLHAWRLSFRSPARPDVEVAIEAPLPHDLEVALKQLRKYADPARRRRPRR